MARRWSRLLAALTVLQQVSAICYYPDGTASNFDEPCYDGEGHSVCCGFGFACLSNRICMATQIVPHFNETAMYVRGSCTDETWRDRNCPSFCVDGDAPCWDSLSSGEGMGLCPGTLNTYYCLNYNQQAVSCDKLENIALHATGRMTDLRFRVVPY
jgi:hypothetical protein